MGSNRRRGGGSPHPRIRDTRPNTRKLPEKQPGNRAYFYRRLRLEWIACSLLFSSPPADTAGNVNRNVAPCPAVLFTKTRPPCIPTTSYRLERFMASAPPPYVIGLTALLKGLSNMLLSSCAGIS